MMKLANGNYIRTPARHSWWLSRRRYFSYMMRELSSLFIGIFTLMMVWGLFRYSQGETEYSAWILDLWNNSRVLSVMIFLFAVYHSFTWFSLTPKAMPVKIGSKRVAGKIIIGAHLLLWLSGSVFVWTIFVYGAGA